MFYEIQTNTQNVNTYFEINSNTGDITVRIPLYNDPTDTARYTFIVVARDGGSPQQVSIQNAQVTINVIRNLNPPVFQNLPYETTVPFFVNNGVEVYNVLATDIDTVVSFSRKFPFPLTNKYSYLSYFAIKIWYFGEIRKK